MNSDKINRDEVCIFIPTLNEAPTIGSLIRSFKELGFTHILVMDGRSSDKTVEIAGKEGAQVEIQKGKGKGDAIIEAIHLIKQPYILMLDGDGTYLPEDSGIMLNPLFEEGADQVIGNRLKHPDEDALSRLNRFGNEIMNYLFKVAHGVYLQDILSGYRAFTCESIRMMNLRESGFEIETEIAVEAIRNEQKVVVVPVQYKARPGTRTKLHPVRDGAKIFTAIYRLAKTNNPLFYFGIIGMFTTLLGVLVGVYVLIEWFSHIEHIPLTILTVLLIMVGFEIFMFGIIADMLVTFNRELRQEIHNLRPPKPPQ